MKKTGILLLLLLFPFWIFAQQRVINGVVTDNHNEPLIGVAVMIKGTTFGTVTDIDGKYSLSVPNDAKILSFSFLGYEPKDMDIKDKAVMNIFLEQSMTALDEVTITALGISREKKALGYSVGEVKSEELTRVTQENVLGALSGKVAGVQIQNTGGDPGSSTSIIIRGATSLGNDNQPLFVIDGVPVNNTMSNVDRLGNAQVDYGSAETYYNNGIKASMDQYKIGDNFSEYIAQDKAKFDGTLKRIIEQKWISQFLLPESWFDFRRTGLPEFPIDYPAGAIHPAVPLRFKYPTEETRNNLQNYTEAVQKLEKTAYSDAGNDDHYSKPWILQGTNKPW